MFDKFFGISRRTCVIFLFAIIFPMPAFSEDESEEEAVINAMINSFDVPLGDLAIKQHDSEWRNLLNGLSGGFAYKYPLMLSQTKVSDSTERTTSNNMVLQGSIKYNPLSYWFASANVFYLVDEHFNGVFKRDFTYSFGYNDWHPYTFSLVYSNSGNNKLFPDKSEDEKFTSFENGGISLGWKFLIPEEIEKLFLIDQDAHIGCGLNLNLTPRYTDIKSNSRKSWKHNLSVNCKYPIYDWFYVNATAYYYPDKDQQQPSDPDFTYGFGYFDWHPGTISIQYNNFAGNRFPWKNQKDAGEFWNGSLTINWSWVF